MCQNTRSKLTIEVQNIIDIIEGLDFSVSMYEENGIVCGAEIESWTDGGVDMIHFIDLRRKDINSINDWKEGISAISYNFDVDEEIDLHREDKGYREAFTCRMSVHDFENWQERLRALAQAVIHPEIKEKMK